jgi:hypothetical protein
VLVRNTLRAFLKKRCCTEGAANTFLKGNRFHAGAEKLLAPACETCTVSDIGSGGWKRSRAFCDWKCCPSFNAPCMLSLLALCQNFPTRLKIEQAMELDAIITTVTPMVAKPGGSEDTAVAAEEEEASSFSAPPVVVSYSADDAVVVADVDLGQLLQQEAAAAADYRQENVVNVADPTGVISMQQQEMETIPEEEEEEQQQQHLEEQEGGEDECGIYARNGQDACSVVY